MADHRLPTVVEQAYELGEAVITATSTASVTVTVDANQLDRIVAVTVSRRLH